jgi:protein transport protein SEC61 subunit gamma-like protein
MVKGILKDVEIPTEISFNIQDYWRVFKLTRKPTREEFKTIAKVAGAGILLIGFIGFILYLLITELPQAI